MYSHPLLFTYIFQCMCIRIDACVLLNPCPHIELVSKLIQLL